MDAESNLGIRGQPYYFYVMRTHPTYSFAIFLFQDCHMTPDATNDMGATPFDSGGLWCGKIHTDPPASNGARKAIFSKNEVSLGSWEKSFSAYLLSNYTTLSDYVAGTAPRGATKPIVNHHPNEALAWTWEVRYPHGLISARLKLHRGYMAPHLKDDFLKWLSYDSERDLDASLRLRDWVVSNVHTFDEDATPRQKVTSVLRDLTS